MCTYLVKLAFCLENLLLLPTKNPTACRNDRNQIQIHGLLNKSKEKISISFILFHIYAEILNLVADGADYPSDGLIGLGQS